MGRWAQRRRSGGSKTSAAEQVPLVLVSALYQGATLVRFHWNAPVTAGMFDNPSDFASIPSNNIGTTFQGIQLGGMVVQFTGTSGEISTDSDAEYNGDDPGFKTPDTIPR